MIGWVKLHRSLLDWEWYDDINATRLLVHFLISVNYEDKKWKGILIPSGSLIFSYETLSKKVNLSVQQIRTALKKIESSGEITRKATNKYQVVTLVKWDKLQHTSTDSNKQTDSSSTINQQSNNNQSTTTKEVNNIITKEIKEIKGVFNFRKELLNLGCKKDLVEDWLKVRKNKKATNSETAYKSFLKQVELSKIDINNILEECVVKSWSGFKAEWIKNKKLQKPNNNRIVF